MSNFGLYCNLLPQRVPMETLNVCFVSKGENLLSMAKSYSITEDSFLGLLFQHGKCLEV